MSPAAEALRALMAGRPRVLAAIDGGSASGKTTLAGQLARQLGGRVVHMDDFFLPPELRTPQRLEEPGGNVHRERFLAQVLAPLRAGRPARFRPFDCAGMDYGRELEVLPGPLCLVEGAYAHHPDLRDFYDLRIFLRIGPELQRRRVLARNGPSAEQFFERWIPLENRYFQAFDIPGRADLVIDVT